MQIELFLNIVTFTLSALPCPRVSISCTCVPGIMKSSSCLKYVGATRGLVALLLCVRVFVSTVGVPCEYIGLSVSGIMHNTARIQECAWGPTLIIILNYYFSLTKILIIVIEPGHKICEIAHYINILAHG